jgi:hypothetical protein
MSNLIRFPARHRPQQSDPPCDELTVLELEIEVARARLAQIRSEVRQDNIFLSWYCLKRVLLWGLLFWLLATFAGAAHAQTRSFYDSQGRFAGSSTSRGNSRSFYDHQGSFAGSATRQGNTSSFYDQQGRFTGSSINTGPRR